MKYPIGIKLIGFDEANRRVKEHVDGFRAQYDDNHVIVYQAYNDKIADYALEHQKLGGEGFSFSSLAISR